jgi:hypothetical protein
MHIYGVLHFSREICVHNTEDSRSLDLPQQGREIIHRGEGMYALEKLHTIIFIRIDLCQNTESVFVTVALRASKLTSKPSNTSPFQ